MKNSIITLLTDFGTKDHYVASMKGIILSIHPSCTLVDLTHEVSPYNIKQGAFLLAHAYSTFPKGTIHLAVVDPGVGGSRRPILIVTSNYFFIGPDNGLFTLALRKEKVEQLIALMNQRYFLPQVSFTFHGRDIFAPVAGYLSLGVKPKSFGKEMDSLVELDFQRPHIQGERLIGQILHIDPFGNLISNIDEQQLHHFSRQRPMIVEVGKKEVIGLKKGYWEVKKGRWIALIGSGGFLEVSIKEGNAQKALKVKEGDKIQIKVGQRR